jgi:hypothetical protein
MVQFKEEYSLLKATSGMEVIKPPGSNLNRNMEQKLLMGCMSF